MHFAIGLVIVVALLGCALLAIDIPRIWRRREAQRRNGRRSADGSEIIASTDEGPSKSKRVPSETVTTYVLDEEIVRYACGHDFVKHFGHDFYGDRMDVNEEYAAKREKCGDCMVAELLPKCIRCCACGCLILPGEPVAVYQKNRSFKKEWSTVLPSGDSVIGCMRWDCCPSGGFFAGHWTPKGFQSAFGGEAGLMAAVIAAGKPMVVKVSHGQAEITVIDDDKPSAGSDKKEKKDGGSSES